MQVQPLGREDPLEEEMASHPSVLAWRIPWTEEPGGLQSMGFRVGHHLVAEYVHAHGQDWEPVICGLFLSTEESYLA